jgi:hypothetical protein
VKTTDFDFSGCRYDPTSKSFTTSIREDISEFASYKGADKKQIFTYVVSLYDKSSPLWDKEPEYFKRKILAANVAKLPKNDKGAFKDSTKEILEGKNDTVNVLVVAYLANLGDVDYMMLINEITMFHGVSLKALGGKNDGTMYKTMQLLSEGIRSRTRQVFGSGENDELSRIRILLYESTEKDRQKLNPEAIVKLLEEEGEFPQDWNPYGVNYEVEPLKYHTDE